MSSDTRTVLSSTLQIIAGLSHDDARYWGSELHDRYGDHVYSCLRELSRMDFDLRRALGSVWTSLLFADDVTPWRKMERA